ncbi:aminotransferase class I/II-fold pyridoxal phosphate-dependent enzyme [Anaerosalibacter massiliensis]|uniref:Aminotransferase class I/II-fold pyridoxal phosphate-dependent enzyme n=1 Tax=Anaerosalibacter massiliensis TaxID=1347392 RepID=A0A9X2S5F1_9FIRM|nr:aminotransferase class I/II-fold pyridoxal phosphate-dependent enzyme [Anaerosalibacter massiliensis]MCR2044249.1 aminotransferase class I/II-fold pyridoxal phosphate-dependent enzyme [Anaerosalibacter massiliensis]
MDTPIFKGLKKYIEEENISFHTPGHKGKNDIINWKKCIPSIDLTEVEGLDNLQDPKGIILESQKLAAKTFKAKETFYSVNGSTGGIYIALSAITNPGDKVLIQRNCHKSVYNGIILNNLIPKYIYPKYNEKYNILTGINPLDIENSLKENPDIVAVVITYPNYYGICSDIEKIVDIVHKYNKILLVDEAHGSHLIFSKNLPMSALESGADIVVQSTHKTLPSFTQTSMIHVGTSRVDIDKLKDMYNLYQTTSPSYIFMASLDITRAYMEDVGRNQLELHLKNIEKFRSQVMEIDRISIFEGDMEDSTIKTIDKTKILINIKGIKGTQLESLLRKKYNIQLEMSDYYYALALTTLMNTEEDFNNFKNVLEDISIKTDYEEKEDFCFKEFKPIVSKPIREGFFSKKASCSLKESVGKVSASFIIPYPPGVPIIAPGEIITKDIYEYILFLKQNDIEIVGLLDYNREKINVVI